MKYSWAEPMALLTLLTSSLTLAAHHPTTPNKWHLGNGIHLERSHAQLEVTTEEELLWSTIPGLPFISASGGSDLVTGSNGAFNITTVDVDTCQSLNISHIDLVRHVGALDDAGIRIAGSLLGCGSSTAQYELTLFVPQSLQDRVAFSLDVAPDPTMANQTLSKVYLNLASKANEDIYGLGAQASFASLKNQSIPIFSREQGVGRGDEPITSIENANGSIAGGNKYTTYTAIPSYITSDGGFFYLDTESTALAIFDFTQLSATSVRYDNLTVSGAFGKGRDMFEAIEKLTAYTGRMPALPRWVDDGAILGIQGGQDKVERIVQQGLNISCPIAGVWLQDWVGTHSQAGPYVNVSRLWWNWENDEKLYPTWPEFVQNLRQDYKVRTLSYINTFLANVSTKDTGFRRNLYEEANTLHYTVQNATTNDTAVISSGPGLDAGIIDLTNPELVQWFAKVLHDQVWSANISGFMSDFGEYTPVTPDTRLANGENALLFHNQYPTLWAAFQRQVVEQENKTSDAVIFHRSASMGSNRYMNLFWVGDQNVDWGVNDGIKSVVTIMVHMGFSGYAHLHSDVGGYTTTLTYQGVNVTRSAELLGRWGELAAVSSAAFRSHEGNVPQVNAQFYSNASTYEYYAYNARMFAALGPYRRMILDTECATKGWPLLRAPVMYHPQDMQARDISYQSYYLGAHLYVAPVLDPGITELEVYLPGSGSFTHVWTNVTYQGGQTLKVPVPYGKPAVFLVGDAESCVPELHAFLDFVAEEANTTIPI